MMKYVFLLLAVGAFIWYQRSEDKTSDNSLKAAASGTQTSTVVNQNLVLPADVSTNRNDGKQRVHHSMDNLIDQGN